MQQPIDYRLAVQNPLESFTSGYKQMAGILDYQDAKAAEKQKQLEAQQAAQQQEAERQAMNDDLHTVLTDPNADLHKASLELTIKHPGLSKQVQDALMGLGDDQKKDRVQKLTPIYTAALSGNTALVNSQADALITQAEQSGQKRLADEYRTQKAHYNADPNSWMLSTGLLLNSLNPEAMKTVSASIKNTTDMQTQPFVVEQENQKTLQSQYGTSSAQSKSVIDAAKANVAALSEQLGLDKTQAEIDKINADIAAENEKIRQEGQKIANAQNAVPDKKPEVIKLINEASNDATAANEQMNKALDLATRFDAMGVGGFGSVTSAMDWIRRTTGFNGDDTALRDEYNRFVTPAALAAYTKVAPGTMSDVDVTNARKGWPEGTTDPKQIASFLRGVAKLSQVNAVSADLKTQWLSANDHPGTLARDTVINGVTVPAGQTFDQFLKFYLPRRLEFLKKVDDAEKEGKSQVVNRKPDAPEVKKPVAQKTTPASIPRPQVQVKTMSPTAALDMVRGVK